MCCALVLVAVVYFVKMSCSRLRLRVRALTLWLLMGQISVWAALGRGRFDGLGQARASGEQRQRRDGGQQPAMHRRAHLKLDPCSQSSRLPAYIREQIPMEAP